MIVYSTDRKYCANVDQPDGNTVFYRVNDDGTFTPLADRFSDEAARGENVQRPSTPIEQPALAGGHVFKITDESDGQLVNRGYAYWPNAWVHGSSAYVFVGHVDGHPRFFNVHLQTGEVTRLGVMIDAYGGTGEGWYWDAAGWIYLCAGSQLRRVNPFTQADLLIFDIAESHPDCVLWQAHSSDDGQTHSATVMQRMDGDASWPKLGTVVVHYGQHTYYERHGELDESAITSDGVFLVIKEDNDNRIITVGSGEEHFLNDEDGAVGHSDCGPSCVIGEDNILGACVYWDLRTMTKWPLFTTWNMGHVSVRGDKCLLSDGEQLALVALDGSGITPLLKHGMVGTDYDHQVMGSLDPRGLVATYMSNVDGRMDAYLTVLP